MAETAVSVARLEGASEAARPTMAIYANQLLTIGELSGALTVLLPDQTEWKTYGKGETFIVDKDKKFKLIVKEQTAYHCLYK